MSIDGFAPQGDLFGTTPTARDGGWEDKLYFALLPDVATKHALMTLAAEVIARHHLSGRPNAATLHVSVLGIGLCRDLSAAHVAVAEAAAKGLAFRPFALTFTSLASYPRARKGSRYPLVLRCGDGADGVDHLAEALREAMIARRFTPAGKLRAEPHLSLLYDNKIIDAAPLRHPITMSVTGVALVRNHVGQRKHDVRMFTFRP